MKEERSDDSGHDWGTMEYVETTETNSGIRVIQSDKLEQCGCGV